MVIQKSLREGFELIVSEALWKEKTVMTGKAGGIAMRFLEPDHHDLIDSVEDYAAWVLELLTRPGGAFGRVGCEHVRQHFFLPRLVRGERRLIKRLVQAT